jgi:hypothetical protein
MSDYLAGYVDGALREAGIRIVGVSIPQAADRTSWRIAFAPEATALEREQAASVIAALDLSDEAVGAALLDARMKGDRLLRAAVIWMAQEVGKTREQAATEIAAIYRTL